MDFQVLASWRRAFLRAVVASMFVLMTAMPAIAQVSALSSIRGTVSDATGGALPGVTVTLTSPALQVAEMTAVTQADGSYRFGELPPGIYRLKFELTGFNTLVREELRLTVGFEARVDAPLTIGTVQESVTVSGESPVVDLAKTTTAANLSKDQIAMLPVGRGFQQLYAMTPGVNATGAPDVGDSQMNNRQSLMSFGVQTASKIEIEGINIATDAGEGGTGVYMSSSSVEEAQIKTSGNTAEVSTPGISMTTVLKSGSNSLHGTYTAAGQRPKLQSSNLDDRLRAQRVSDTTPLRYYWETSGDLGGRIIRDKLWFYIGTSLQERSTGLLGFVAGPGADGKYLTGDEPLADYINGLTQYTTKVSYQLSNANKLVGVYQRGVKLQPQQGAGRFRPLEATIDYDNPGWIYKGELQSSLTSRMFLNVVAGYGGLFADYSAPRSPNANAVKGNPSRTDLTTGLITGAYWNSENSTEGKYQVDSSLNFLPDRFLGGRHELKFGNTIYWQHYSLGGVNAPQGNYQLVFDAGQPTQIVTDNLPLKPSNRADIYAAYAQDSWRVTNRVTANLGVRWERQHAYLPKQTYDGSPDFPTVFPSGTFPHQDLRTWVRTVPRLGLAWDLDGKTVVKTSFGLYNVNIGPSFGFAYNRNALSRTTFRWRDLDGNGDYTPGETNLNLNGGDFLSLSGGGTAVPAPDLLEPLTTEVTAGFERELAANVGFRTMYVFRKVSDRYADVELNRPRSAYDIPLTRRDPGPDGVLDTSDDGGKVTIYDYNAAYRGAAFSSVQRQNATTGRTDHFNSFEVSLVKRLSHRWSATGSFWGTKNYRWLTLHDVNPNNDPFPLDQTWFWAGNVTATYLLPAQVQVGAYLQSKVGILGQRTYQFRATDPDGGPPLTSLSTVTLRLEPYGSMRAAPQNVLNLRISKLFPFGNSRASVNFEIFNVLNSNADTGLTFASGPTYGYSTGVLPPRVARIGGTYSF
jgi:Carboxypeptidase regulatory-like domain